MSIEKIYPEDIEVFTLETFPQQSYVSSSVSGPTGSAYVYAVRSKLFKDLHPYLSGSDVPFAFSDATIETILNTAKNAAVLNGNNVSLIRQYFDVASNTPSSVRRQQKMEVYRFNPGIDLNYTHLQKRAVLNSLFEYHRPTKPSYHYAFTNYHSLNFFTASSVNSDSVLLYPHEVTVGANNTLTGSYFVSSAFSFDFWINPRYTTDSQTAQFTAGCLLHLSSCYAVSLVTGSQKDVYGKPNAYRLLLQLSGGADRPPSSINLSSLPDLCFATDDNALAKDKWHHVTIRWGGGAYNNGSGSIIINDLVRGTFAVPSASIIPTTFGVSKDNPTVLCVGNFYEGTNAGSSAQAYFFTDTVATQDGVKQLISAMGGVTAPTAYTFRHPLKAEVHDIKIYDKFLSDDDIQLLTSSSAEPTDDGLKFFLPPFFTKEAPTRAFTYGKGGVLVTPFQTKDGTTDQPFSTELSYELGGHYINLENFTRDFSGGGGSNNYPRLLNLTASVINTPVVMPQTADTILYATKSVVKRSITVLPNDNGSFTPKFATWLGTLSGSSFVTDLGTKDETMVSLRNLYSTGSVYTGFYGDNSGSLLRKLFGPDPNDPASFGNKPGNIPAVIQRTRDTSSNQVVFFDVSNLFYGNRIHPGSIELTDYVSGSDNKLSITLKDDGYGNLYRANPSGSSPVWCSVGNVFYDEGVILIKHPSLYFFGSDYFSLTFKGETSIHTLKIGCTARPLLQTSSSNASYIPVETNDLANEPDKKFVYITDVLIHDDNLNVVGRGKLAQPYPKKTGDKTKIYWRMDF